MAAAEVDYSYLCTHAGVPQSDLDTLVTAPTVDLVKSVLGVIVSKFQELEQDKFQLGVELEGAIRGAESRCEQFKSTTEKALKEVEELRQKLQGEETTRRSIENELQTLKSSGTASLSEIETLRARIASLETSNRETLAIVDSKTTANATLSEELQKQHQKILKLNQEITALNQSVQTAQTAANSAKYREESLKQELELSKKNNDWYDAELKTKTSENLKIRKEKGARIAELQRQNEDALANVQSLTRAEQQLRKRLEEAQSKAEEALTKVQQLQESAARAEESFRQELESSKRLVELKDQQSQTHRNRLREVELRLEQVKDDSSEEIRRVRRELEKEKEEHSRTEQQIQELQTEIDRLKALSESQDGMPGSVPQTPRANGSFLARPASPFGTPTSIRGKASHRVTEAFEEFGKIKNQLVLEQRRSQKLQEDLDDAVSMLEAKLPEIDELTAESERLRNETIQMSEIMEQSYEERDAAVKAARKAEATAATTQAEIKILRTQLRDLSTQIHVLIFNIHAREKGMDQLTDEETAQFERLQRGEVSENALEDMSDTHRFITERFTAFKDIYELQQKNEELLKLTRELATKMENEEALAVKQQAAQDHEEVQQLRLTVSTLQDEVQSMTVRMKSHMTERDMFRRMLQQKATPAEIQRALGTSEDADQREPLASIEQGGQGEEASLAAALRELQAQFDSYRNDHTTDRNAMKDQIDKLSSEKGSLQSEISRLSSQLTLATERYNILESNFKALQTEKQELQKRNQTLSESAAKQDIRTQQVAEDLIEARSLVESLRSESANLKAEKTLWKTIQDRLSQDNEALAQEKTRLNGLVSSQQSLLNEREMSESETKRRLQAQVDSLDTELATTKRKLSEEAEEAKKIQLRKEFDAQQFQKRIDELTSMISQIKEENVQVKTTRDHLQARVGELEIEVRNAQERADRLRPLPTPRPGTMLDQSESAEAQARIEELEGEVQELKNNLDLLNVQLENAKQQAEQFKQLSKDMEEELTSLGESHEQYRQEMDEALEAKTNNINELQQRVQALTTELGNSNNELNALRDSQSDVARKFEEKERMLNAEIARIKDEEERARETAKFHQQDLRAQAEIATKAQQDYEVELIRHAEASKLLQQLRTEHNELKTQSAQWRAEAESARLTLTQSEQSWEERQQQLEQEVVEIKARRDDVVAQNKLLHQQLDSVTGQIASLQQSRFQQDGSGAGSPLAADTATEGLRELNNYLRREKEILEVQYDIKVQEAKRLQQQLEYSQLQLDEARLKLDQERLTHADSSRNALTHKELMEKLNELNLIRESNVTLRNENQRSQAELERRSEKIAELENRIQPLDARISELELDKTFKEQEVKQLQEARDGLQKRIESILSKYGQADPQETEQLKATIATLESERDALKQSEESLQQKVKEAEAALETKTGEWNATKARLAEDFKTRFRNMKTQRDEAIGEKNTLQGNLDSVTERLSGVEQELETAKQELASLTEKNQLLEQQTAVPAAEQPAAAPAESGKVVELTQQLETLKQQLETVTSQKAAAEAQVETLRQELATAVAARDQALAQAAASGGDIAMADRPAAPAQPVAGLSDEERKALEEKIAAAEAKAAEFEQKAKELEEQAESIVKQRSEKMKSALNRKLSESKEAMEKQAQEDRAKMQAEFELKLQQELAIVKAEQQTAGPQNGAPPATPSKPTGAPIPQTPGTDLSSMTDAQIREFVATNQTVGGIVKANIKKLVAVETKKIKEETEASLKAEYEQKIVNAREQATALNEKKSALRINMLDRQGKAAQAKIAVVETAARETPQRPVVEVWDIAKDAKPPVAPAPTPAAAPSPKPPLPAAAATVVPAAAAAPAPAAPAPAAEQPPSAAKETKSAIPTPASGLPQPKVASGIPNPFGAPAAAPVVNPFGAPPAPSAIPASSIPASAATAPSALPTPAQPQAQIQPPAAATAAGGGGGTRMGGGIPVPSARGGAGGGRGARGVYQAGPGRGGRGGRGGFGGRGGGAAGGLNPGAGEFNPGGGAGSKRQREGGEGGQSERGGKRARGGGGGGQ